MKRFLLASAMALAASAALAAPPPNQLSQIPGPNGLVYATPVQQIGFDSATGLACVIGKTATCSLPGGGSPSGPAISFQQTSTTSAVPLASHAYANGVVVTAATTNSGVVCLGGATVTVATGYCLVAGQSISYYVANSNQISEIAADALQVVAVTGN